MSYNPRLLVISPANLLCRLTDMSLYRYASMPNDITMRSNRTLKRVLMAQILFILQCSNEAILCFILVE